jgi:hypothetical protein
MAVDSTGFNGDKGGAVLAAGGELLGEGDPRGGFANLPGGMEDEVAALVDESL